MYFHAKDPKTEFSGDAAHEAETTRNQSRPRERQR